MIMWGQPPSAVRASDARLSGQRGNSRTETTFSLPYNPCAFPRPIVLKSKARSFAPRTAEGGCPHIVEFKTPMPQAFYRRQLPHLQLDDRQHFVTFCTERRWVLPQQVRSIVLGC